MDKTRKKTPVIVCCGGGIDSTAALHYYLSKEFQVMAIHFDYGQTPLEGERLACQKLSRHFGIVIQFGSVRPPISPQNNQGYFGRNLLFLLSAINYFQFKSGLISLGIHAGTPFYDCSTNFCVDTQTILNGYTGGRIVIDAPFIDFSKKQVIDYCIENNVPIELTFSCQVGPSEACGSCFSCLHRQDYDERKRSLQKTKNKLY